MAQPFPSLVRGGVRGWVSNLFSGRKIQTPTLPLPVRAGFKRGVAAHIYNWVFGLIKKNVPRPGTFLARPPVRTRRPPVGTRSPPIGTRRPPVGTRSPPIGTRSPPIGTRRPPIRTRSPPIGTRSPPIRTRSPPVGTRGLVKLSAILCKQIQYFVYGS